MNNRATHIVLKFPSKKMDLLYRASDGMSIACRSEITVIVGTDANPERMKTHKFMDEAFARAYLNRLADLDLNELPIDGSCTKPREQITHWAVVDERDNEKRIVSPGASQVLAFKN